MVGKSEKERKRKEVNKKGIGNKQGKGIHRNQTQTQERHVTEAKPV